MHDVCANCGGTPTSWCSRCKLISYCSKECQKSNFREHKKFCAIEEDVLEGSVVQCNPFSLKLESFFEETDHLATKVPSLMKISEWWYLPYDHENIKPIQDCNPARIHAILNTQHPKCKQTRVQGCDGKLITFYWNDNIQGDENLHPLQLSGVSLNGHVIAHFE